MAVIWQKQTKHDLYEVRQAGASIRLYSNGVFHSQYNPKQEISNSIWDLLILPLFFYPHGTIKRILLLGVGGGAAIKLLRHYSSPELIIGVELDSVHIKIARRFFQVTHQDADLVCDDAVNWLKHYKGLPFDLIIDDLFGHKDGEISRAVSLDSGWFTLLNRHLSKQGLLVINTAELSDFKNSGFMTNQRIQKLFHCVYRLTHPTCDNRIFVFSKKPIELKTLKQNVLSISRRQVRNSLLKLVSRIRKFKAHSG